MHVELASCAHRQAPIVRFAPRVHGEGGHGRRSAKGAGRGQNRGGVAGTCPAGWLISERMRTKTPEQKGSSPNSTRTSTLVVRQLDQQRRRDLPAKLYFLFGEQELDPHFVTHRVMGVYGVPPACQPPTIAPSQHCASMDVAGCADVGCAGAMCTAGWWKLPRAGGARRGASAPLKRAALRRCLSQLARASAPARPRWEAWLTPVPEKVNWRTASVRSKRCVAKVTFRRVNV